jgi:RNA polymerase sigma-54 factor
MVEQLRAKGFKVARRTIAKYREELRILPSHLRKEF